MFIPVTGEELRREVEKVIRGVSNAGPMKDWDVSRVRCFDGLFRNLALPPGFWDRPENNIGHWKIGTGSKITMNEMFYGNDTFNLPLFWDVSYVEEMNNMFRGAKTFNQPLNHWDVSLVRSMAGMFSETDNFNQPLDRWDIANVQDMFCVFRCAKVFDQPFGDPEAWARATVTSLEAMFYLAVNFNQPVDHWNVRHVTTFLGMFNSASRFNQPLNSWVFHPDGPDLWCMFIHAESFNQPLDRWDMSAVKSIGGIFYEARSFNQPLHTWRLHPKSDIDRMFSNANSFRSSLPVFAAAHQSIPSDDVLPPRIHQRIPPGPLLEVAALWQSALELDLWAHAAAVHPAFRAPFLYHNVLQRAPYADLIGQFVGVTLTHPRTRKEDVSVKQRSK